jgi:hypothetical protein
MPHSKRDAALSTAASGALTSSVLCNILVTPNPKPAFASVIGVAVRPPLRRSRLRVTEWIGALTDGVTVPLRTQHSVEPQPRVCSPTVSSFRSRTATPHLVNAGCDQFPASGPTTLTLPDGRPHNHWRRLVLTRALQPTHRSRPSVLQSALVSSDTSGVSDTAVSSLLRRYRHLLGYLSNLIDRCTDILGRSAIPGSMAVG